MDLIIKLIRLAFDVAFIIIVAQVAISWLIAFGVINTNNPAAQNLVRLLAKATDPVYKPLRKIIPDLGGIDITPIIVLFALSFAEAALIGLLI
jgi:YggT family protein